MIGLLDLQNNLAVLEPACGDGAFVEALRGTGLELDISCLDKNPAALDLVRSKYGNSVKTLCVDTILDQLTGPFGKLASSHLPQKYDRIIGNPPYGGWIDYETRAALKKLFPGYHVRETYTLFLLRCLELLKAGGILSFIIPDTLLTVGSHRKLRELLLRRTEIIEILTLPSKLFPGVAFAYSGLCIITVRVPEKGPNPQHNIQLVAISNSAELESLSKAQSAFVTGTRVLQKAVLEKSNMPIWTSHESHLEDLFTSATLTLGDVAECKTGIYTGDNKRFIRSIEGASIRGDYYETIPKAEICERQLTEKESYAGLESSPSWIAIVKGGSHRFIQQTSWAIDWSNQSICFYRTNKKARFQNSQFYFREGIGVPMVTSQRVNAFLTERRVFDQSVVGIFPTNRRWLFPLLVILNTKLVTRLLKEVINPTANNSANYLKRLPLPELSSSELRSLGALGRLMAAKRKKGLSADSEEQQAEDVVESYYRQTLTATKPSTSSVRNPTDAYTPMFPCLS
jgi:hypothetical protein